MSDGSPASGGGNARWPPKRRQRVWVGGGEVESYVEPCARHTHPRRRTGQVPASSHTTSGPRWTRWNGESISSDVMRGRSSREPASPFETMAFDPATAHHTKVSSGTSGQRDDGHDEQDHQRTDRAHPQHAQSVTEALPFGAASVCSAGVSRVLHAQSVEGRMALPQLSERPCRRGSGKKCRFELAKSGPIPQPQKLNNRTRASGS